MKISAAATSHVTTEYPPALRDEDGRPRLAQQGQEPDGEAAVQEGPDQGRAQEGRSHPPLPEGHAQTQGRRQGHHRHQEVRLETTCLWEGKGVK